MKKGTFIGKGVWVFLALFLACCATYTGTTVKLDPSQPAVSRGEQGDLTVYVEEYCTPEKCKRAFDADLAEKGVLPVLLLLENHGKQTYEVKNTGIQVRGDSGVLKSLTPEEAARRTKRSAIGRAIGWGLIVPMITIPFAVAASVHHTAEVNKRIVQDFTAKSFTGGDIRPNKECSGFLFFELDEERKDLAGLSLQMTARNVDTGETVRVAAPLPTAALPPREKEISTPQEDEQDLMDR